MEPVQGLGFAHFLAQTDAIGKTILAALIAMSLVSWYLIIVKSLQGLAAQRRTSRFLRTFWDAPSLQAVETHLENPIIKLTRDAPGNPALVSLTGTYHNLLRMWADP